MVWTDALQLVSLLIATVVIIAASLATTGGLAEVWDRAERGGRLELFK